MNVRSKAANLVQDYLRTLETAAAARQVTTALQTLHFGAPLGSVAEDHFGEQYLDALLRQHELEQTAANIAITGKASFGALLWYEALDAANKEADR
jgi:hypothetical protein